MPIYEFKCENCRAIIEKIQKMSDPYPTECPKCNQGRLTKLISPSGFVLKGSGWYATDFKAKPSAAASSASDGSASSPSPDPKTTKDATTVPPASSSGGTTETK